MRLSCSSQIFRYRIPFHSAIAARVYIQLVLNSTIAATTLGSVENQAAWWTLNYRTSGDQNQFVTTINNHEATKGKQKLFNNF